ncbi:hypothetical protein B0H16DRAFT_1858102 [Mycena metata]|uniref:Uncharacterized protein n=1 Tax=Mycena metata TaxID=1033252 RepID=A0AAD7IIR1_9AGAR|nr:hypothetical protein B0H16DRAFT_1858102 [Mycena metata]
MQGCAVDASTPLILPTPVAAIVLAPQWIASTGDQDGFILEIDSLASGPDLPSNMLPSPVPANLNLTPKQLETIYWQARDHDGCYKSVTLFQHFFDLYPSDVPLPRAHPAKRMTIAYVVGHQMHFTGSEDEANVSTILDLASLQFGDGGRGLGGRSTFALESLDAFYDRVEAVALSADTENARISSRIGPCADDAWLKTVAARAKERWEARDKAAWCGHCGGPGEALKNSWSLDRLLALTRG